MSETKEFRGTLESEGVEKINHLEKVVKSGDWMIRVDTDGRSYSGFKWNPKGEWTVAPDWNSSMECGNGLHGQGPEASGFRADGNRLVFCETDGERINLGNKVKVLRARILLVNELPPGLKFGGCLYLGGCTGLTALPEGLSVGDSLYLRGCKGLTALPEGLSVGGSLYLEGCKGLTALPEGLSVGGYLDLRGCTGLTALPEGLSVGGSLYPPRHLK